MHIGKKSQPFITEDLREGVSKDGEDKNPSDIAKVDRNTTAFTGTSWSEIASASIGRRRICRRVDSGGGRRSGLGRSCIWLQNGKLGGLSINSTEAEGIPDEVDTEMGTSGPTA